ncbi:MAG: ABC transporter permease [Clostridia bacterium]|nr:ABC transporter permease [Clostridia bacterium]
MTKYLLRRILHGLFSVVVIVAIVMILIYSLMDRKLIFATDSRWTKATGNDKKTYELEQWEKYGYLDYVTYGDWVGELISSGELSPESRKQVAQIGKTQNDDKDTAKTYIERFRKEYEAKGYTVVRLDAQVVGKKVVSKAAYFAYKDYSLIHRLWTYFSGIVSVDNVHNAEEVRGDRGISFTLHDPAYAEGTFAPALIGNGTTHKYLLYTDGNFPFVHQNLVSLNLGKSYSVNRNIEITRTMTQAQGSKTNTLVIYPTGYQEESADDIHSLTYEQPDPSSPENTFTKTRYVDGYTKVDTFKNGFSKMGYSFVIGIISVILTYLIGAPIAIWMAQKKDKLVDQIGSVYVVFITAMPSLAYIFIVKAIGNATGIPTTFDMEHPSWIMYVLPIISLSLRPIASMMRWLRRYMVDQQNADYVKFARSTGASEGEIFRKHILKNAAIPIVHGIPGAILFSMVGALITERVYVVPGVGGMLIEAIDKYDNGVIVGVTLFYAVLSIVSLIIGDILMSVVDPRINFTSKAR